MTDVPEPFRIALDVAAILDELGIRYTIGGSIESSLAGEPRSTVDIDFVVELQDSQIPLLTARLAPTFYVDTEALHNAVRNRSSANVIHQESSIKVDLFIVGGTPLDQQQLGRRRAVSIGANRTLHVHPPEDILLQKLRWYRLGGEVSDRQWRDIMGIVRVQGARLDRHYLHTNAVVLGVSDLLARVLATA